MLITTRLRLRQWTAADLEPFAALNADPVVIELMGGMPQPAQRDAFARWAEAEIAAGARELRVVERELYLVAALHLLRRGARCPNMRAAGRQHERRRSLQPHNEVMART